MVSKYEKLWKYISTLDYDTVTLTFEEIEKLAECPIDHSFLRNKKELEEYGWVVKKIAMKEQKVTVEKCKKIL